MLELAMGKVVEILSRWNQITEIQLEVEHPIKKALNYNQMTGEVAIGDWLYLNTTAGSLSLGTGGYHFVMANASCRNRSMTPVGHGMKLRYTPFQVKVPFIEETLSYSDIYNKPLNLKGRVVCFGELHSMIPPLCAYFRYYSNKNHRIAYIMTDHAALPLAFSKSVEGMKKKGLIDVTITIGNAFGGDYECVNIYTGLQTAAQVENCDLILVSMGPGITGTGTQYGFSGLDLGFYVNLAHSGGGQCLLIPRISFADKRGRHYGLSHHTLTMMNEFVYPAIPYILPALGRKDMQYMFRQIFRNHLDANHKICVVKNKEIKEAFNYFDLFVTTMGRGIEEEPAFFKGIGAVAEKALTLS